MNILDFLFPPSCLSCQKLTGNSHDFYKYLCQRCLGRIKINEDDQCFLCHIFTRNGKTCSSCQRKTPLKGIIVASDYDNLILKETIHYFKYRYVRTLALPLSWILLKKLNEFPFENKKDWLLIPVPLAKRRLHDRGFNQTELLAQNLSKWLNISVSSAIIERVRFRTPQMEIKNIKERIKNIQNSFSLKKEANAGLIKNKRVILIDDVATTGATLSECAKILKPYVKEVWGCVIAK